jgi:hypothetical protein
MIRHSASYDRSKETQFCRLLFSDLLVGGNVQHPVAYKSIVYYSTQLY